MTRKVWLVATMISAVAMGLVMMLASPTETQANIAVRFGLPGNPIDPAGPAGGGATHDRVDPEVILLSSGATLDIMNQGGQHRIAIYDKNLTKNGSGPTTTYLDITDTAGSGNFLDDPVGRLFLGAPGASTSTRVPMAGSALSSPAINSQSAAGSSS
jgi:hypothetical protein